MSAEKRKIAVVTGASRGIGLATARLLSARGHLVIGLSRSSRDTRSSLRCDIGDDGSIARAFATILKRHRRVDVLVNCAALAHLGDPLSIPAGDWERVLRVNVTGAYLCAKAALPAMKRRGYGRIVNVSSIAGRSYSRSASVLYTSSKAALLGMTRQLAAGFARHGITVNCVCPSQTETEMLLGATSAAQRKALAAKAPIGRLARPLEVAEAIAFLASEAASYVNGACLDVNGGQL